MERDLTKCFSNAKYETEENLADGIWHDLVKQNNRSARIKLSIFSVIGFSSFIALIPTFLAMSGDLARSGFYNYFSLLFSDTHNMYSYGREFAMAIADALPYFTITIFLSLILVLFLSLRLAVRQFIIRSQLVF